MDEKTQNQEWGNYRLTLLEEKSKSEDHFEKAITYISSGALVLSITFIDKLAPLEGLVFKGVIGFGWLLLTVTIFINLYSHYQASQNNEKTIEDIDENKSYNEIVDNVGKRNKFISRLNCSSIVTLALGLICILIYSFINMYNG